MVGENLLLRIEPIFHIMALLATPLLVELVGQRGDTDMEIFGLACFEKSGALRPGIRLCGACTDLLSRSWRNAEFHQSFLLFYIPATAPASEAVSEIGAKGRLRQANGKAGCFPNAAVIAAGQNNRPDPIRHSCPLHHAPLLSRSD
jgi:hypothetical protein